jgi:crotonobetainyl-CoA hydratase
VKRGILAAAGGAFRISAQLPPKIGLELLLTGDAISAYRALGLGLVNAVVPPEALMAEALKLAARIALNAPLSVQASKRIARGIHCGRIEVESAYWETTRHEAAILWQSEDAQEGPLAFAEKRQPVWKAR